MSSAQSRPPARCGSGGGSCGGASTRRGSSSASGVTQAEIDVWNDLPRNGPSGTYSHAWMSRALQSLTSTTPKTWSANALDGDRLAEPLGDADDEAELELDVEPPRRPEHGLAVAGPSAGRAGGRRRCR